MKSKSAVASFALAFLLSGAQATACQISWKSPGKTDITSISAHLVTSSGGNVHCKVTTDHYLLELAFKLVCVNGSTVEIGRSPYCGGQQEWPDCDYGLIVDRSRQTFKLRQETYPHQSICANGLATTVFGYRLSQTTFSFEAFVEVKGPQQKEKRPLGF